MALTLRKMGFEAWALKGGLDAWRAAGLEAPVAGAAETPATPVGSKA